jgi:hypothetical protein
VEFSAGAQSSHSIDRRSFLQGGAALIAACTPIASCGQVATKAVFNPATVDFFKNLAVNVLGAVVYDLGKTAAPWVKEAVEKALTGVAAGACWGDSYLLESSKVLLVHMTGNRPTPVSRVADCPQFNPLADHIALLFPQLKQPMLLPAWAWQTLSSFEHGYRAIYGESQSVKDTLRLALRPMSPRVSTISSRLSVVKAVSYQTATDRWVDIGLSKTSNQNGPAGLQGHIEIQGLRGPGAPGENFTDSYLLPSVKG